MTASDELSFIASALIAIDPVLANRAAGLIVSVRKLERFVDETVANAQDEARLAETTANVVSLERFRRIPIGSAP